MNLEKYIFVMDKFYDDFYLVKSLNISKFLLGMVFYIMLILK